MTSQKDFVEALNISKNDSEISLGPCELLSWIWICFCNNEETFSPLRQRCETEDGYGEILECDIASVQFRIRSV